MYELVLLPRSIAEIQLFESVQIIASFEASCAASARAAASAENMLKYGANWWLTSASLVKMPIPMVLLAMDPSVNIC